MGACFDQRIWDGKLTHAELKKKYDAMIYELMSEHGTDAYSGHLNTLAGFEIRDEKVYSSEQEAHDWLADNCEKWENAIAVRFEDIRDEVHNPPTFGGKLVKNGDWMYKFLELTELASPDRPYPLIKCFMVHTESNVKENTRKVTVIPADQLTELQRERLKKDATEFLAARLEHKKQLVTFNSLLESIKGYQQTIPDSAYTQVKKLRKSLVTSRNKVVRIGERLAKKNEQFDSKLWKVKKVDHGKKWIVGGWCSS